MRGSCNPFYTDPLPPLRVSGNELRAGGKTLQIRGINWFGFNNGQTAVDGLWAGGTSFATDFNTIVYKLKLLGFNAVRLPFTFSDLKRTPQDKRQSCTISSKAYIINAATTPGDPRQNTNHTPCFYGVFPRKKCNEYLTSASTTHRFAQMIETFINNGLYVVLDYHPMGTENQARNVRRFAEEWASLWKTLLKMQPAFRGRVMLDIMNEPDSMQIGWTRRKTPGGHPSLTELSLAMMDKIHSFDNGTLYLIEGTGQVGYNLNWGDGFVTDKNIIAKYDIDDASEFFQRLSTKPYRNNLIIGVHMYGPTISKNRNVHKGQKLFARMDASFGYLFSPGFQGKYKFPIIVGEFGSFFKDPDDMDHLNDFAKYLRTRLGGKAGWMFWAYNANSGDTGGIVTDDWQGLNWIKLRWLQKNLGLRPWYAA